MKFKVVRMVEQACFGCTREVIGGLVKRRLPLSAQEFSKEEMIHTSSEENLEPVMWMLDIRRSLEELSRMLSSL
jgi:hypothetical protein